LVLSPRRILADVLSKGWVEAHSVPGVLAVVAGILARRRAISMPPICATLPNMPPMAGLVVLALLIVVAVGGIDLSVGSNLRHVGLRRAFQLSHLEPAGAGRLAVSLATGALIGSVNGVLAGLIGCGALLTTTRNHDHHASAVHARLAGAAGRDLDQHARRRPWDWIGFEKVSVDADRLLDLVAVAVLSS
jgi:ribose transport system permease protein